jgi:2-methylisocitrate lyase-like PEP mutase family enzyme
VISADLIRKAEAFRRLHQGPELLVLPNIWDPLGARLLHSLGYPAVATASAAVAYSLGYDDGERITFTAMLDVIRRIADSVEIPLTADLERGYADTPQGVADNARRALQAGAVGINLEDSHSEGGTLRPVDEQCARIAAVRAMATQEGVPLLINARTDVFMGAGDKTPDQSLRDAIDRGISYVEAGADCLYPIGAGDRTTLTAMVAETGAPINVYARQGVISMAELKEIGVRRLSLGPNLLRASLEVMRQVARDLKSSGSYDLFGESVIASTEIQKIVSGGRMPEAGD